MQVNHTITITGGQDAGTQTDIKQIRDLLENLHSSDVLAALKVGLNK